MKKVILIFIGALFSCGIFAQGGNTYTYPFTIGKAGTSGGQITLNGLTSGSTILSTPATGGTLLLNGDLGSTGTPVTKGWFTDIDVTNGVNAGTLYVELLPDSTAVADDYTLVLADAGNDIYVTKATHVEITIPSNASVAFPIGTTINFFQAAAGGIRFIGDFHSIKDSTQTDGIWSVAALKKRGADNWILYGHIEQ